MCFPYLYDIFTFLNSHLIACSYSPTRNVRYVPFNGPICVSMVASTSTQALLFWSWVNQSQNALGKTIMDEWHRHIIDD